MSTLIGWVFLYSLLVIVGFYLYELLAARGHWPSKDLYQMILHMLQDPELADRVWNHPLIQALTPPARGGRYWGPVQIPPELFAIALFDSLPASVPGAAPVQGGGLSERVSHIANPATRDTLALFLERSEGNLRMAESAVADWFELTTRALANWQARRLFRFVASLVIIATAILAADALALWLGLSWAIVDIPSLIGSAFQQSISLLVTAVAAIGAPLWGSLANQAANLLLHRRASEPPLQRVAVDGQLSLGRGA